MSDEPNKFNPPEHALGDLIRRLAKAVADLTGLVPVCPGCGQDNFDGEIEHAAGCPIGDAVKEAGASS